MRRDEIKAIAEAAGEFVREAGTLVKGKNSVLRTKARGDVVTQGDLDIERYIIDRIRTRFPEHGIISEERGEVEGASEYVWVLDPIDGTKYYASGLPFYAISLALRIGNTLVLGIVYSPELDMFFSASSGLGATLNGASIRCSEDKKLEDSYICLEIPSRFSRAEEISSGMEKMRKLIDRSMRVRIIGVSSLGLCFCAMSAFDGFVNLGNSWNEWDIAGGQFIAVEAGMKVSLAARKIIAGPPLLHDQLVKLVLP